jgi:uncharacterized DUF497 family protein
MWHFSGRACAGVLAGIFAALAAHTAAAETPASPAAPRRVAFLAANAAYDKLTHLRIISAREPTRHERRQYEQGT